LLIKNHIKHEKSAPYSPHQNGTAERGWRTLFEMSRCLLLNAKLPKELWNYAVMTSTYIRNRCYNSRINQTPYEAFTGRKPNISNMHIFGSKCYTYEQIKSKLDDRCKEGIFIGYDKYSPAFIVYYPDINEVRKCRCVKFIDIETETKPKVLDYDEEFEMNKTPDNLEVNNDLNHETNKQENDEHEQIDESSNVNRYPKRETKMPKHLEDYVLNDSALYTIDYYYHISSSVPQTYQEAISSSDVSKWKLAMEDEMKSLIDNDTFTVTQLPDDRTSVGGKWVYSVKTGPNSTEKFKARYVAKGYSQIHGIDYYDTFAPTARITSIRVLMQLIVQCGLIVHQMDVKTAYLNAPIDCEIYVDQPEGFEIKSQNGERLVCKLNKSLYGLKQSGRNWNNLLHDFFSKNDFVQSPVDKCMYVKHVSNDIVIVLVWVDDIIIAASNDCLLQSIKDLLKSTFKMTDLGQLSWFLGIQFLHDNGTIRMNQTQYLTKLLEKYNMNDCKSRCTPCELKMNVNGNDVSNDDYFALKYREIVGSLIYAMSCTRPDLCYIVTTLSQYLSGPTSDMCTTLKHVLRYIKGTLGYELCFTKSHDGLQLKGYSDASWGSTVDRKSVTGYCFTLNKDGPLISWKSKKQPTVALSSCEAEYMALAATTQECLFISHLISDLDRKCQFKPVTLFSDNQGAIALVKNAVYHQRSKHIDIKFHFIRDEYCKGNIDIMYLPTEDMIADIFTKPVSKFKLVKFKNFIFCSM
jgi:hypothetical protein